MSESQPASRWLPGVVVGVSYVALSFAITAVLVAFGGGFSLAWPAWAQDSVRVWLIAHGSTVEVAGVAFTVIPIGAVLVGVALAYLLSRWAARRYELDAAAFAITAGASASLVAAIGAVGVSTDEVQIPVARAAVMLFAVVWLGGYVAASSEQAPGAVRRWLHVSVWRYNVVSGAALTASWVVVAAMIVTLLLLMEHRVEAANAWATLDPGVSGGIALAAVSVLAIPTLVFWAVALLLGPGVDLPGGATLDLSQSAVEALPIFPPLAAIPAPGQLPGWAIALAAVIPLAAGIGGWRSGVLSSYAHAAASGAGSGAVAAVVLAVPLWLSQGALGADRLSHLGPPIWQSLAAGLLALAVGGAVGALLAHYRGARAERIATVNDTDE